MLQAGLGVALVLLLAVHLIVNHWAAPHGLLTYEDVLRYYRAPGIAWMETLFLVAVALHCVLGMHSILLDLNLSPRSTRVITVFITLAGGLAILYGIWLILTVVSLSGS